MMKKFGGNCVMCFCAILIFVAITNLWAMWTADGAAESFDAGVVDGRARAKYYRGISEGHEQDRAENRRAWGVDGVSIDFESLFAQLAAVEEMYNTWIWAHTPAGEDYNSSLTFQFPDVLGGEVVVVPNPNTS